MYDERNEIDCLHFLLCRSSKQRYVAKDSTEEGCVDVVVVVMMNVMACEARVRGERMLWVAPKSKTVDEMLQCGGR